jgi:hypothetical protein
MNKLKMHPILPFKTASTSFNETPFAQQNQKVGNKALSINAYLW